MCRKNTSDIRDKLTGKFFVDNKLNWVRIGFNEECEHGSWTPAEVIVSFRAGISFRGFNVVCGSRFSTFFGRLGRADALASFVRCKD